MSISRGEADVFFYGTHESYSVDDIIDFNAQVSLLANNYSNNGKQNADAWKDNRDDGVDGPTVIGRECGYRFNCSSHGETDAVASLCTFHK